MNEAVEKVEGITKAGNIIAKVKTWGSSNVTLLYIIILVLVLVLIYTYGKNCKLFEKYITGSKTSSTKKKGTNKETSKEPPKEENEEELDSLIKGIEEKQQQK